MILILKKISTEILLIISNLVIGSFEKRRIII